MKTFSAIVSFLLLAAIASAQSDAKILGKCYLPALEQAPYSEWYQPNFQNYIPHADIVKKLKPEINGSLSIKIVFGTWCGDSKREVPRLAKLLHELNVPQEQIECIAVDDAEDRYKRSPGGEERGLHVYRVPTFIVYEKGKEVGRINEFAVESLERDLLQILTQKNYQPNYRSFAKINEWLSAGLLNDPNVNPRGLAGQIKPLVLNESELNSCGYVLLSRGEKAEAITVFRINANLFPQSANCFDSLGEAYAKAGDREKALMAYQNALKLDPESKNAKDQIAALKGD